VARTDADRGVPYYPTFLDLTHKRVVVVGAGVIGSEKVHGLLPCRPDPLVVIAPHASDEVQHAAAAQQLVWLPRPYQEGDLTGAAVVFAATNDRTLNATVASEARRRHIPVLAVDDIPNCDLIAPAIVRRGDVVVAISTGGQSPAFARWLRERLDRAIPAHWGTMLTVAARARLALRAARRTASPDTWQVALGPDVEALAAQGEVNQAVNLALEHLGAVGVPR
jgi:precorrin-2 dehydrogenase/sirohydrochlorin ferrochelatase